MSEVTLHGYPVKVGDKVWSIQDGDVTISDVYDDCYYKIKAGGRTFTKDGEYDSDHKRPSLFWQPISPEAIEAAKVKPKEPEYEWKWQYTYLNSAGNYHGLNETDRYYKTEKDMLTDCALLSRVDFIRIERSKREVQK